MTQFLPGEVGTITVDFSSYPAPSFRIITSVTFFGILFFILVRNALKRKLDILLEEEEEKRKSDNTD